MACGGLAGVRARAMADDTAYGITAEAGLPAEVHCGDLREPGLQAHFLQNTVKATRVYRHYPPPTPLVRSGEQEGR